MENLVKILIEKLNKLELENNSNRPAQEGTYTLITLIGLEDSLHLSLFPEREGIMIYKEKERKLNIKRCHPHFKTMSLMKEKKRKMDSFKIQIDT